MSPSTLGRMSWFGAWLLFLGSACAIAQDKRQQSVVADLYAQAKESRGVRYMLAREKLSSHKEGAIRFLRRKAESAKPGEERAFIEVLLGRLSHSADVEKLESDFQAKVRNLKFLPPRDAWLAHGRPNERIRRGFRLYGLLLHGEQPESGASPEWSSRHFRLATSSYWPVLAQEVVWKGWCPSGAGGETTDSDKPITQDDYLLQAIAIAGKMRLTNTKPRLRSLLRNEKANPEIRTAAAIALGRLADTGVAPTLMELLTKDDVPRYLRKAAFEALSEGGMVKALPLLDKIAAGEVTIRGRGQQREWSSSASRAARELRERAKSHKKEDKK